ncbi:hypothetical protein K402DRAFT_125614 [Aulographum hederae CBS 113979]|uniref:Uncharacterized protein n=1 Tax=Aulographum hederae CBS 113979 TaxID=1176131 RepID=A0A6G1HEK2_9PEZI|nr:hypothetical protein K402DRAFT_125614 [Aulographum hederae CBS 113979]
MDSWSMASSSGSLQPRQHNAALRQSQAALGCEFGPTLGVWTGAVTREPCWLLERARLAFGRLRAAQGVSTIPRTDSCHDSPLAIRGRSPIQSGDPHCTRRVQASKVVKGLISDSAWHPLQIRPGHTAEGRCWRTSLTFVLPTADRTSRITILELAGRLPGPPGEETWGACPCLLFSSSSAQSSTPPVRPSPSSPSSAPLNPQGMSLLCRAASQPRTIAL